MIATIETELGYDESSNGRRRRPPKGEVSPEAFSPNINPQVELYIDHLGNLRCRTSFKLEQPLPESALITVSLKAKKRGAAPTDPQMESGFARMFAKQNQTDYELSFPIYLGFEGTADGRVRVKHPNGDFVEVPFAIDIPSRKMKPADSDRPRAAKRANGRPRTKTETLPPVFVPEIPAIPADSTSETPPEQTLSSMLLNIADMTVEHAAANEIVKPSEEHKAELPQEALYSQTFGTNGVFRAEVFEKGDEHVLHLSGPALTEISVTVSQPDKTVVQRSELLGADGHAVIAVPKPLQPGEAEYLIKTGQTYLYFNGEDKPKLADMSQAVTSTTEHSFSVSLYEKEPKTSQAATTTEQRREKPTNERKSSRPQLDVTHSYEKGTITLVVTNKGGAMEMGAGWQATRQNPDYTSVGRYIKSVIAKGEVPALVDENQSHTIEFAVEPGATFYFSLYGRVPELIKVPELDVRN